MTIRKKLFWTNTFMVLLAMLVLLGIGGSMICLFKDEFLRWYGSHSQLADRYTEVYAGFPEVLESDSWDGMAEQLTDYGFRLIVIDEDRNFVYNNAKHSEEEGTEALFLYAERCRKDYNLPCGEHDRACNQGDSGRQLL